MPRLKSPAAKGNLYEREIAAYFNDKLGLSARRAPLSGGGASFGAPGSGVGTADLMGVPGIHVEAKFVQRLAVWDAIDQAERSVKQHKSPELPTVITRRNRVETGQSLVVMRLEDWIKLYASHLREQYGTRPTPEAAITEDDKQAKLFP